MSATAWKHLQSLVREGRKMKIRDLLDQPGRLANYSISLEGLYLDFSKHLVNDQTLSALMQLARESDLQGKTEMLVRGEPVNVSENRAALHTGLRNPLASLPDGFFERVLHERHKMMAMCQQLRSGAWTGHTGKAISDVINIGIGGSSLGPKMMVEAMQEYHDGPEIHFVSNVDGAEILRLLPGLDPETTLVVICSKSFGTAETMLNAQTALNWLGKHLGLARPSASTQCIGITGNTKKALEFGIPETQLLTLEDSTGGRYSLWSAAGLSACLAVGDKRFMAFLEGGATMDRHFLETPYERNMPVVMALLGIWYNNFLGAQSHAVIPYCQRLRLLVDYLQQLDMESNGKSASLSGKQVSVDTGPIIWGQTGTDGQHAFFQLLHQGTKLVPVDFIGLIADRLSNDEHHAMLLTNMIAQAEGLMTGKQSQKAHLHYPGNRPSSTLLMDELSPFSLGMLIALHEHKVFVQSVVWSINPFDQWGVELGKQLADKLLDGSGEHDPSTLALLAKCKLP